jgi:small multidrug resistance pump
MAYFYLFLAIVFETVATSALKMSESFTKLYPSLVVIIGYALSFYLLTIVMKYLPIGITYAIWSGVGIVLIALIGAYLYNQRIDLPAIVGMGLIIGGIAVIRLFSKMNLE